MQVESRDDLENLMRVLVHARQYPSDDWNAVAEQARPSDRRTLDLYRNYMSEARQKGTA